MALQFPSWDTPDEARMRAMRLALVPLADLYMAWMDGKPDTAIVYQQGDGDHVEALTVGDIRRARALTRDLK